jgi:hypothetical protein
MMSFFVFLFFVGLVKYFWNENKGNMFIMLLNNLLVSKFSSPPSGISRAEKQLSGVYHVDYTANGSNYTFIIPPQKRRVKWDRATARTEDGSEIDVTDMIKPYAGPHGNFMNFDYHPHHLFRNAKQITVYHEEMIVRQFGTSI